VEEAFVTHYSLGVERDRLLGGGEHLELVRTLQLLRDALPPRPGTGVRRRRPCDR
jgi:hypothetical protein